MNLDRRIKKHIHGKPQRIRVPCVPGLENAAQAEIRLALSARTPTPDLQVDIHKEDGELTVKNIPYADIQFLLPRLRSASEVFLLIAKRRCLTASELATELKNIVWEMYLGKSVRLRARSFKSKLYHETLIKELVGESLRAHAIAVVDDEDAPLLEVVVRRDEVTIEIGLAGRPLHHRDYKTHRVALAPLKAHVAYSCIATYYAWIAHHNDTDIIIPFAGSGTLGFEAVLYLCDAHPGLWRHGYAIKELPFFKKEAWHHHAPQVPTHIAPMQLRFVEKDAHQVAALRDNCLSFFRPFGDRIIWSVEQCDVFSLDDIGSHTAFMNPPYGERLVVEQDFFASLQRWIEKGSFSGFALSPEKDSLALPTSLRKTSSLEFQTGGRFTHMKLWDR